MILIAKENDKIIKSGPKDNAIYVKVNEETRNLIDKYKGQGITISDLIRNAIECYNNFKSISPEILAIIENYKESKEPNITFIERAIKYFGDQKNVDRDLWNRARDEMKMMLIGKTTFNQLIRAAEAPRDSLEKPYKKNVGIDLILWYNDSRPLKSLSMEEIINTVQKLWKVANYFHTIDVNKENEDQFHLLFRHRQNKRYGTYWLGYFTELFTSEKMPFKCNVEGQAFDESISMSIKVGYKKD